MPGHRQTGRQRVGEQVAGFLDAAQDQRLHCRRQLCEGRAAGCEAREQGAPGAAPEAVPQHLVHGSARRLREVLFRRVLFVVGGATGDRRHPFRERLHRQLRWPGGLLEDADGEGEGVRGQQVDLLAGFPFTQEGAGAVPYDVFQGTPDHGRTQARCQRCAQPAVVLAVAVHQVRPDDLRQRIVPPMVMR